MYLIKIIQNDKIGYYSERVGQHTATPYISYAASFLFAHEALKMIEKLKAVNPDRSFLLEEEVEKSRIAARVYNKPTKYKYTIDVVLKTKHEINLQREKRSPEGKRCV